MRSKLGTYFLFISIILWGTILGGIVYSHIVYFPVYLSALPDSAVLVRGEYGLNEARFWLLVHPLTLLSLIITLILNWTHRSRRKLILTTLSIYVVVLVITQIYFLPELRAFASSPESSVSRAEWFDRGQRWQHLSWARGAVMFAAILPLLIALTKSDGATNEAIA